MAEGIVRLLLGGEKVIRAFESREREMIDMKEKRRKAKRDASIIRDPLWEDCVICSDDGQPRSEYSEVESSWVSVTIESNCDAIRTCYFNGSIDTRSRMISRGIKRLRGEDVPLAFSKMVSAFWRRRTLPINYENFLSFHIFFRVLSNEIRVIDPLFTLYALNFFRSRVSKNSNSRFLDAHSIYACRVIIKENITRI